MPFATIAPSSTARVTAPTRATRGASRARARAVVVARGDAAPSSTSSRDARPTAIVASVALSLAVAACGAVAAPARAEETTTIRCDWTHPCTPPPPDGKPRYELPGSTYDPAREAVKRYLERQNQSSSSSAPAVATTTTTTDDRE